MATKIKYDTVSFRERLSKVNPDVTVLGEYLDSKTGILCRCNNCFKEWSPSPNSLLSGHGCYDCANAARKTYDTDSFKKKMESVNPNIRIIGEYVNSNKSIKCECRICGNVWAPRAYCLLEGRKCPSCTGRGRKGRGGYNTTSFKNKLRQINPNITVLGKYVDGDTNIKCKCNICGNEWNPKPRILLSGSNCPFCAHKQYNTDTFKQAMSAVNPNIIIIGEYKGAFSNIECKCAVCGKEWSPSATSLLSGHGCNECSTRKRRERDRKKYEVKFLEEQKKVNPGIFIKSKYTNSSDHIECECLVCGFTWDTSPASLKNSGCPSCANCKPFDFNSFKEELKIKNPNLEVLRTVDKDNTKHRKVLCRCVACGYEWPARVSHLLNGHSCPKCCHYQSSFAEQFITYSLKEALGKDQVINRYSKAIGKELDIYIPKYSFAIEFNGWAWHKNKITQDKEKARLCRENGIKVLFIYDACPKSVIDIDDIECMSFGYDLGSEKGHVTLKKLVAQILHCLGLSDSEICVGIDWSNVIANAIKASRRKTTEQFKSEVDTINTNVEILGEYVGSKKRISCKCKVCGNEWNPIAQNLLRGSRCPCCAGNKVLKEFNDLATVNPVLAAEWHPTKNGSLTPDMVTKGSKKKVWWKCKQGHEWQAVIANRNKGSGCPYCYKLRRLSNKNK